jgi:hypothetical protein
VEDTPLAKISRTRSKVSHPSEQLGKRFFILHLIHGLLTSCPTSKSNLSRTTLIPSFVPSFRNPPYCFELNGISDKYTTVPSMIKGRLAETLVSFCQRRKTGISKRRCRDFGTVSVLSGASMLNRIALSG